MFPEGHRLELAVKKMPVLDTSVAVWLWFAGSLRWQDLLSNNGLPDAFLPKGFHSKARTKFKQARPYKHPEEPQGRHRKTQAVPSHVKTVRACTEVRLSSFQELRKLMRIVPRVSCNHRAIFCESWRPKKIMAEALRH